MPSVLIKCNAHTNKGVTVSAVLQEFPQAEQEFKNFYNLNPVMEIKAMKKSALIFILMSFLAGTFMACDDPPEDDSNTDLRERKDTTDTQVSPTDTRQPQDTADTAAPEDTENPPEVEETEETGSEIIEDTSPEDTTIPDEPDTEPEDIVEIPPVICPDPIDSWLGVHIADQNGPPLEREDTILITIDLVSSTPSNEPIWIEINHRTVNINEESLQVDGQAFSGLIRQGNKVSLPFDDSASRTITYEAVIDERNELILVVASLNLLEDECPNGGSSSGALFQLPGTQGKTPMCLDLAEIRSLQVAPLVLLSNTQNYLDANGARDDLLADDFIFCPQNPTIVHTAEFCITNQAGLPVRIAGHHSDPGTWEVDDFMLFEVFRNEELIADGITTQTHPGRPNQFYCNPTDTLMCEEDCTATLTVVAEDREIQPLAVVSAVGEAPRQHDNGAVDISSLLPNDNEPVNLRITALDVGIEGEIEPAIYLLIGH